MSRPGSAAAIAVRLLGTALLLGGLFAFVVHAPFLQTGSGEQAERVELRSPTLGDLTEIAGTGTTTVDPAPVEADTLAMGFQPTFGLFDATFAATPHNPGFETAEVLVPGTCLGAGQRYFDAHCQGCQLLAGNSSGNQEMLVWQEIQAGNAIMRSASRDCIAETLEGIPVVATVTFRDGPVDLAGKTQDPPVNSLIPLLDGAERVAAISMGSWSATYDSVARPGTALSDMANALKRLGWREVAEHDLGEQPAFEGHRVFTNDANAVCMLSLQRQGDGYQLLTIVNTSA